MTTTNYNWNIGVRGQKPYWTEWSDLWTSVDTELYKRSKDLYMQGKIVYGSDATGGNLLLKSNPLANGKIYLGYLTCDESQGGSIGINKVPDSGFVLDVYGDTKTTTLYCSTFRSVPGQGFGTETRNGSGSYVYRWGVYGEVDIATFWILASDFDVNSHQFFVKQSTGRVGIGTANPGSKLSVVGLPTSAAGLSAGDIWNNGGVLNIV